MTLLFLDHIKTQTTEDEEEVLAKYKATGSKRVFLLAEVQGVPENRNNYEIILKALDFASIKEDV